jgi:hypothetical protein
MMALRKRWFAADRRRLIAVSREVEATRGESYNGLDVETALADQAAIVARLRKLGLEEAKPLILGGHPWNIDNDIEAGVVIFYLKEEPAENQGLPAANPDTDKDVVD